MKPIPILLILTLLTLSYYNSYSQERIKSDTTIAMRVKVCEDFHLDFISCPTCGYGWKLQTQTDTANLKIVDYATIENPKHKIGGYVTVSWTFQGLIKGDYQLVFIYKRPWLDEIEKRETVYVRVDGL